MGDKDKKWKAKHMPQEVLDSAHRIWLAGLGALSRAEDEGGRFFRNLVERGEEVEGEGRDKASSAAQGARERAKDAARGLRGRGEKVAQDVARLVDERVDGVLHRLGVPSRQEIERLTARVEELNQRIAGMGAPAAKPAAPKTAARPRPAPKPKAKPAAKAKPKPKPKAAPKTAARPAPKPAPKPPAKAGEKTAVTAGKGGAAGTSAPKAGSKAAGSGAGSSQSSGGSGRQSKP
jgi:poly(hydroxyalkanoate) granule-associated protein